MRALLNAGAWTQLARSRAPAAVSQLHSGPLPPTLRCQSCEAACPQLCSPPPRADSLRGAAGLGLQWPTRVTPGLALKGGKVASCLLEWGEAVWERPRAGGPKGRRQLHSLGGGLAVSKVNSRGTPDSSGNSPHPHPRGHNSWEKGGAQKALQPSAAPRPWLDQGGLPHPTEDAGVGRGGRIPGLRAGVLNCEDKGTLHSLCREDTGGLPNPELAFRLS